MIIINAENGEIEYTQVFDTYLSSSEFDEFITSEIPANKIIVTACKDDCATNLSVAGR